MRWRNPVKLSVPVVIGVTALWSCLALGISYAVSGWPTELVHGNSIERQLEVTNNPLSLSRVSMSKSSTSQRVQAEVWSTVGEKWNQGRFDGTAVLEGNAGIQSSPEHTLGSYVSTPWRASFTINALSAEWRGYLPQRSGVTMHVRTSADGQAWSSWWEIPRTEEGEPSEGLWIGELVGVPLPETSRQSRVQYKLSFQNSPIGASPIVESLSLTVINSMNGPLMKTAKSMMLPIEESGSPMRPPIISRAGWGADESLMRWEHEYRHPTKVVIHHTVTYNTDPLATIRAIYYYHAVTRGWGDVGYNYLIDDSGNIYEGRMGGEGVVAGHARKFNYGSIGIALLGDFTDQRISQAMETALVELLTWIAVHYGIAPQGHTPTWDLDLPNIVGHRDIGGTSCPGEQVYLRLPYMRAAAERQLLIYPPEGVIQAPEPGIVLAGETPIEVSSTSPNLVHIELIVDDQLVFASEESPLIWTWDTKGYTDGEHLLKVVIRGWHESRREILRTVVVDNAAPDGAIVIDNGATYARDPLLHLTLAAVDLGVGVQDMELAEDGEWGDRETFRSVLDWELSTEEGVRQIAIRLWDKAGNVSPIVSDTIVLDSTPPTWDQSCTLESGKVRLEVKDELSGIAVSSVEYSLSQSGGLEWRPWQFVDASNLEGSRETQRISVPVSTLSGSAIRFRAMDGAGNWSTSRTCVFP